MLTPTDSRNMGLGFFLRRFGFAVYLSHSGGNVGFSSWIIAHPEAGYGVVVTTNTSGATSLALEIKFRVADMYNREGF